MLCTVKTTCPVPSPLNVRTPLMDCELTVSTVGVPTPGGGGGGGMSGTSSKSVRKPVDELKQTAVPVNEYWPLRPVSPAVEPARRRRFCHRSLESPGPQGKRRPVSPRRAALRVRMQRRMRFPANVCSWHYLPKKSFVVVARSREPAVAKADFRYRRHLSSPVSFIPPVRGSKSHESATSVLFSPSRSK